MTPYTETQKKRIAKNIVDACKDIEKLNNTAYKYLNLCSGFIAHYDLNGFKAYYSDYSLQDDIEQNARQNQWHNFRQGDRDYDYYMSKRDIYNMVLGYFTAQEFMKQHVVHIHVGA